MEATARFAAYVGCFALASCAAPAANTSGESAVNATPEREPDTPRLVYMSGYALTTCAEFGNLYGENPDIEFLWFNWAQGYLSGAAYMYDSSGRTTRLTREDYGEERQKRFIRHYCSKHPLHEYVIALAHLLADINGAGWSDAGTGEPAGEAEIEVIGPGVMTCAEFAREYRTDPKGTELMFFDWARGYLSGMSHFLSINFPEHLWMQAPPDNYDDTRQKHDLRNYCESHPLNRFPVAVGALWADIQKRD